MPWLRTGDNAATYPALMKLQGYKGADDRTVNEAFGFIMRCSTQSAAHLTDYVIDAGTAYMLGGARTEEILRLLVKSGILTANRAAGERSWTIIADPEFIHIRTKAEVEWDRQRKADGRNVPLMLEVRLRDGDQCRWCGVGVQWMGRKTGRSAEPDHLVPGEAGSVPTVVISCRTCNAGRGADYKTWDDSHRLRPPPTRPAYGAATARFLTDNGHPTEQTLRSDETTALAAGAATALSRGVRAATPQEDPAARTPHVVRPSAPETWAPPKKSTSQSDRTNPVGSGRDGNGLGSNPHQGPSVPGHDDAPAARPRPRRRGKRGGRSSRTPNDHTES